METKQIDVMISKMSLEEKIAQLHGISLTDLLEEGKLSPGKCRKIIPHGVGHVCQFSSSNTFTPDVLAELIHELQKYLQTETESQIPAMLHEEAITGIAAIGATITPQMIGMSCSWNPQLVYENAKMAAENMKKFGCHFALSPMMDVITDARWGRAEEGYGEEAYLTAAFSLAFIKGLQSCGVAATAKHFAGYGVENQEMTFFRNEVLYPFEAAVKEGKVQAIMPGYHTFEGIPCGASEKLLTKILREEWNFDGIIVSDYGAVSHVDEKYHYAGNKKEAAIACLNAGIDVEFPANTCFSHLIEAVQNGEVDEQKIDQSLRRVLCLKEKLGILTEWQGTGEMELDPPENRTRALQSAHQAIVLLKNNGILPLSAPRSIAVVGPNADSYYSLLGDYTWMGIGEFFHRFKGGRTNPKLVTLLDGMRNKMRDSEVCFERGCDWSSDKDCVEETKIGDERGAGERKIPLEDIPPTDWNRAILLGKESDVIIAAMGENRYLCGEGCDRRDVDLPGEQEKFVEELCDTGKPVILVVFGGRPMAIANIAKRCAAVIYAWYPGEEGGNAIADIICGHVSPTGKLTVSLPDKSEDVPISYQMLDEDKSCCYPFGFGLTYTDFAYSNVTSKTTISIDNEYFDLAFEVENIGEYDAAEIAQIYLSRENASLKLVGFSRIELCKGQRKMVCLRFYLDTFAEYDSEGNLWLWPDVFRLRIGASSADIRLTTEIKITGQRKKLKRKEHFFSLHCDAEMAR